MPKRLGAESLATETSCYRNVLLPKRLGVFRGFWYWIVLMLKHLGPRVWVDISSYQTTWCRKVSKSSSIFRLVVSALSSDGRSIWPNKTINWFRCYHTRGNNRHRILSYWFQLDVWFFELANQTQRYINFEYRKINNHCFSSKSIFYFFLPFKKNIIKSINYKIIRNNQSTKN